MEALTPYAKIILQGGVVGVRYEPYANFGFACSAFNKETVAEVLRIKQRNLANKRFSAMGKILLVPTLLDWSAVPKELFPYLENINWLEKTFAGKGFLRFPIHKGTGIPGYMTSPLGKGLPVNKVENVLLGKNFSKLVQVWLCTLLCHYETPMFQLLSWPNNSNVRTSRGNIPSFHITTSMNISGEPSIRTAAKAKEFCSKNKVTLMDWGQTTENARPKSYFVISVSPKGWEVIRRTDNLPKLP